MATKEDVLKVLFPNGIPVERLKDLPAILAAAQSAADVALASTPGFVIVPQPALEPEAVASLPPIEEIEAANKPRKKRTTHELPVDTRIRNALHHMTTPAVKYHAVSWYVEHFEVPHRTFVARIRELIDQGKLLVFGPDDQTFTNVDFLRKRIKARWHDTETPYQRLAREMGPIGMESRAEPAQLSIVTSDTPIEVEDDQVQKVLQYIQDGDKTIQDVSKHFHYGQGFIEGILKTAHTKYGFQFNRDAAGTLSIAFIPPKQAAAN